MNKANVFLLVVVSSLLTYISTATQPAATAGVAQEKWEYGKSMFETEGLPGSGDLVGFYFRTDRPETDGKVVWNTKKGRVDFDSPKRGVGNGSNFSREARNLFWEIKENGWQPYQVIPRSSPMHWREELYKDTIYWRRRVQ